MHGHTSDSHCNEPQRPPRRMKSLSEALDSLGHSFHNIYEKHIHHHHHHNKHSSDKNHHSSSSSSSSDHLKGKWDEDDNHHKSTHHHSKDNHNGSHPTTVENGRHHHTMIKSEKKHTKKTLQTKVNGADRLSLSSDNFKLDPDPSPSERKKPFEVRMKNSPTGSPKGTKKKEKRSNSIIWVDFLTQSGNNEDHFESSDDDSELNALRGKSPRSGASSPRKIWFDKVNTPDSEEDENLLCVKGKDKKLRRRDSMAPSVPKVRSPEPEQGQTHRNVDDLIFDMFQEKDEEVILVGKFLASLEKTGLRKTDPRLHELFENLRQEEMKMSKSDVGSIETLRLDRDTFKSVITDNIVLISRAFRQQFIIPEFKTFCNHIQNIYDSCKKVTGGKVAAYIPQLARADPNLWGVSICTIDGQRHSIGDTTVPFTLQSCTKPLTYAIALNELGEDTVHQYVGQEPSGRMFNELILDHNKKPHNPMVNAGAIIVCSLLKAMVRPEMTLAEKFDFTQQYFKRLGGGEYVGFNNAIFLSEREAADRNYALGFYMREHKCFPEGTNLKECMDYYFQCCSMETNGETAAVMAATLANGGICPISGQKVMKSDSVRDVLSLMHSCGMYDYSGQFAFKVGLPAKSGVSGCILLVVPNVLGMAIYSPPLDTLGNTVRGVTFCQELVKVFNFHKYDNLRHASHKVDPRRHRFETKGLNIVNLLFSAASGDVTSMRRHHLSGMDMSAFDYDGRSALHLAAAEGHLECVEYLLRHCYVPHKPLDRWGHTPYDEALRFGHTDVIEFLKQWEKSHAPPEE